VHDATNSDLGKEILLLNKEKELQSVELSKKEIQLKQQTFQRNVLFLGVLALGLLVSFVLYNYIAKQRSNRLLAEANQRWQDLNREKDQLLNIVAHDLRSPVNRIKGLMEIMKITSDWNEEQMQYSRMIDKAIQDSHQLIDDLLVIGRAEYEVENLPTERLELQPYLQTLMEHFLPQATSKNIQIRLIAPQEPIILPTDEDTLSRILGNLMTNAIKFSPTHKNITLRLEGQARQVSISIQDEGQGFTVEDKAKVFQKFQKLTARPTAGESSTGLGLSIVKILTEKLGGHISLESEWQKGSTFTLSFNLWEDIL
jgi:signal transduction histidine kinase